MIAFLTACFEKYWKVSHSTYDGNKGGKCIQHRRKNLIIKNYPEKKIFSSIESPYCRKGHGRGMIPSVGAFKHFVTKRQKSDIAVFYLTSMF